MAEKCLFPAAGYGTRFLPATKSMPKEMLPIVNRPLIEFGVEEASSAGMNEICIVTGRGKRAIEDHFDVNYELEHEIAGSSKEQFLEQIRQLTNDCTFSFTRQRTMRGLGDAVLTGRTLVGDEPFGLVLADDLCLNLAGQGVMQQMQAVATQHDCSVIAVMDVPPDQVSKYGIVVGEQVDKDLLKVSAMVEKPSVDEAPSTLAVIGRYLLSPEIFTHLQATEPGAGGEIQLTDALNALAQSGKLLAYRFAGLRFDCGSIDGFVEATQYYYENVVNKD
ncbi:MAG TPA: UTP--glucose-1-phosphate uridylyltransferase [Gammaproteobacteria bacterium]|nr:UTP--glucose-1-phosphate uridylyltransferase [Gammaproteobacteria bacterium]